MTGADPLRDPIDELAEEFLARYRRGERPALSEFIGRRPDLADDIRDLFPALVMMEEAGPGESARRASFGRDSVGGRLPERLGDYRILRAVGRGGMGVVYEAEQESLGRHVALKVLPAEAASDITCLKRFCREARSAARLHHTNIVPVFDVGAHDGLHYYAMQFIQGQNLDEVLAELRRLRQSPSEPPPTDGLTGGPRQRKAADLTRLLASHLLTGQFGEADFAEGAQAGEPPPDSDASAVRNTRSDFSTSSDFQFYRSLARIGLQIAEALAYAHSQGVLHRDIKPGNLLLDQCGTVWVTDFGLAKDDSEALTRTGNVVGTLRYMPPERFDGVSDGRGDVYSLGLTLYELLTLRPAFDESDQARLIRRVVHEEPPRPRRYDRRVPRDLETIVLKAMAKEPGSRYQTAEAMATDLRHFLADEPIRARRSSWLERVMRLGRRNPVVGGLSAVIAVLTAVSLVVLTVAALIGHERDKAVRAEGEANQERDRARWAEGEANEAKRENKILEHLAQAAAYRRSGQVGQRFLPLVEIRKALDLGPSADLRRKLRDEAAAALVLPDIEVAREWEAWPADALYLDFDASLQRYVRLDKQGGVTVCRLTDAGEEVLVRLPPHGQPPFQLPWMSPDGRFVLVGHTARQGTAGAFFVWKLDGPTPAVFDVPASVNEYAVAFHPDGRHLAVGHVEAGGGSVGIYDLETGQRCRKLRLDAPPFHLAFHPRDGRLAVACGLAVPIFDTDTGREVQRLRHPDKAKQVTSVAWQPPDGLRLAAGCLGRKIYLWDTETAAEVMPPWATPGGMVTWLGFNHAGDRLVCDDGLPRLWDAASGRLLLTAGEYIRPRFSPDDSLLGWSFHGTKLCLWRVAAGRELHVLRRRGAAGDEQISGPVMHADGRTPVLAASSDDYLRMTFFDLLRGEELASVPLPEAETAHLNSFDSQAGAWETFGAGGLLFWPARPDPARAGALRVGPPQGRVAVRGHGGQVGLSQDRRVIAVPQPFQDFAVLLHKDRPGRGIVLRPQSDVRRTAVSPDGRWVVTCSWWGDARSSAQIWEGDSGRHVRDLPLTGTTSAGFSPDGRWLATLAWSLGTRLWEVGTWREAQRFDPAQFAFSPDSRLLALNDVGGVIRLVTTDGGREVARLTGSEPGGYSPACFSPDGTRLVATVLGGKALYVWDLRLIRQQLKAMDLDWDWPDFPPAPAEEKPVTSVTVDLGELGNPREDVALYSLALALQPMNLDAYLQRGRAWGRLKQAQEAIADYSAFLALAAPDHQSRAEVLLRRANNFARLPDQARRLADLLELAGMDARLIPLPKETASSCNDAAWALCVAAEKDRQPAVAVILARKAVELEPDPEDSNGRKLRGPYHNTLGVALFRDGRYRDAIAVLEANSDNADFAAWDLYFLAMAQHRLGEQARAREYLDRAVRWHQEKSSSLSQPYREELARFRVEAEALLGPR
jgi:eukaryotic-like serine/threonine-protein kinase